MAGRHPDERVRFPLLRQRWHSSAFLHWSYEPSVIAELLPRGLQPDVFDGRAWVSMTPFVARSTRAAAGPPLPLWSTFPETNLRTYVIGPDGLDGIWFFTLEVGNPWFPLATRPTIGAPYRWARMAVEEGDTVSYRSSRMRASGVGHHLEVHPDGERSPSPLDDFPTGRGRAYCEAPTGPLVSLAVEHEPGVLPGATPARVEETLREDAGLADRRPPEVVHWSPGVDAALGNLRLVSRSLYSREDAGSVPALGRQ